LYLLYSEFCRWRGYLLRKTKGIPICLAIIIDRPSCCWTKIKKNSGEKFSFSQIVVLIYNYIIQNLGTSCTSSIKFHESRRFDSGFWHPGSFNANVFMDVAIFLNHFHEVLMECVPLSSPY
jgi:hypothetical protein